MFSTSRIQVSEVVEEEINKIIAIESHKDNRDYLWIGTFDEHLAEIKDPNHVLWLFKEKKTKKIIGYALGRLDKESKVFELRRIAIVEKGKGFGREVMDGMIQFVFMDLGFNRFWLDVYPDNLIGIGLYESMGMKKEGVLRQHYKSNRGFLDQIIYSLIASDYSD